MDHSKVDSKAWEQWPTHGPKSLVVLGMVDLN